jgi:hypothetical protein
MFSIEGLFILSLIYMSLDFFVLLFESYDRFYSENKKCKSDRDKASSVSTRDLRKIKGLGNTKPFNNQVSFFYDFISSMFLLNFDLKSVL